MPVNASAVGARFGERLVEVTPRMMLAYAAGIGQTDAWTFDDAAAGHFVAVPQLCVSIEWPTISDPGVRTLLGVTPGEWRGALHVGQDSVFHRPILAGGRLRIVGCVMEVRETRAGAIALSRIDSTDAASGDPVVTSWTTVLLRGVAVQGTGSTAAGRPAATTDEVGGWQSLEIPVPRELPHVYTECAGIWNPIHTERRVALSVGLPDIILHGTATWALAGRELTRVHAGRDPRRLRRLSGRFGAVVIPGTRIVLEHGASSSAPGVIRFRVRNHEGEEAMSEGIAEIVPA